MINVLTTHKKPDILENDVNFINYEQLTRNMKIDLAFEFEDQFSTETLELINLFDIKKIGGTRLDKLMQFFYLKKFDINTPETYCRKNFRSISSIDLFDAYIDNNDLVIKPKLGAKGIGVKRIDREFFHNTLIDKHFMVNAFAEEFELYKKTFNGDDHAGYVNEMIPSNNYIIQDYVPIDREYRMILFIDGDYLMYERKKGKDQFCGNLTHGSKPRQVSRKEVENDMKLFVLINRCQSLLKELNYPWASFDIYTTKENEIGVLEFQMEFAYEGFNGKDIKEKSIKSLNYFIK